MLGLGPNETSASPLQKGMGILSAVYHIPVAFVRGRGAFTNTAPTAPYRSAGRPEVIFVIERLIDLAADRLALDPVALRQRNHPARKLNSPSIASGRGRPSRSPPSNCSLRFC
jgi:aerobic carbon-monoxide dehydrogenase large subunit